MCMCGWMGIHTGVRLGSDDRLCCLVMVGARLDGTKELVALAEGATGSPLRAGRSFYGTSKSGA
jgi:hypothetical protein